MWFNEKVRHSLASKGVPTGRRSGYLNGRKSAIRQLLTTNNHVEARNSGDKGVILDIKDGMCRVLTNDKRIVEIPVGEVEKQSKARLFQEVKEDMPDVVIMPAHSNPYGDPFGEWYIDGYTQIGTGNVMDFKQMFPEKRILVKAQQYSYRLSPNKEPFFKTHMMGSS